MWPHIINTIVLILEKYCMIFWCGVNYSSVGITSDIVTQGYPNMMPATWHSVLNSSTLSSSASAISPHNNRTNEQWHGIMHKPLAVELIARRKFAIIFFAGDTAHLLTVITYIYCTAYDKLARRMTMRLRRRFCSCRNADMHVILIDKFLCREVPREVLCEVPGASVSDRSMSRQLSLQNVVKKWVSLLKLTWIFQWRS